MAARGGSSGVLRSLALDSIARLQPLACPPAALCIHLCIGEAYAFSVFTKPMSQAIGVIAPKPGADWTVPALGWIFSLAMLFLGLSAAFGGKWVERVGPRMAMFVAALLL